MTIKEMREINKLSQSALAKALGVNPRTISRIENGQLKVSPKMAEKVWELYRVSLDVPVQEKKRTKKAPLRVIIQSPYGGEITPEEIAAKIPEQATDVYVRVDQNKLWWLKNDEEYGSVSIWE